jgi:hypothetical protein
MRLARLAVALGLSVGIAGCETLRQPPVSVPIAVPCIKSVPTRPALVSDAELAVMSDGQLVLALRRLELILLDYTAELEAVISSCKH